MQNKSNGLSTTCTQNKPTLKLVMESKLQSIIAIIIRQIYMGIHNILVTKGTDKTTTAKTTNGQALSSHYIVCYLSTHLVKLLMKLINWINFFWRR